MKVNKFLSIILVLSMILSAGLYTLPVFADEQIKISNAEDLKAMKNNPSGSYILTDDIDLEGAEWVPFAFSGILDGDGHCIMNFKVTNQSTDTRTVYDANLKSYDAKVSGFFSALENATIKNLQLLGGDLSDETDSSIFTGVLAGFALNTKVDNCIIIGKVSMRTSGLCAGVSGVIGFAGNCTINGCTVESTLVYEDTDPNWMEEQFMGAVYSFGYGSITNCKVTLNGYDADHGYVHNGGLVGCFMYYDYENYWSVDIIGNKIYGQITFYEDNADRRAYCEPIAGEVMNWEYTQSDNDSGFTRNEIWSYGEVLEPHCNCSNPSIITQVVESKAGKAGYVIEMCENCDYAYKYNFTAPKEGPYINPAVKNFQPQLEGKTDLLVLSSHADDEQLFYSGILPYYAQVRDMAVQVVYCTDHVAEPGRHEEREDGLWGVGITNKLDTSGWYDAYADTIDEALANLGWTDGIGEEDVIEWMRQIVLKYQPQVIISHDVDGEYGHGYHKMIASCLRKCIEKYSSEFTFLKKVYLHLWNENTVTVNAIDEKAGELNGLTPFQVTQKYGFTEHKSQHYAWFYEWLYYGVTYWEAQPAEKITKASQINYFSPLKWGLIYGDASLDTHHNDLFEGLKSYAQQEEEARLERERIEAEKRAKEEAERLEREEAERQEALARKRRKTIIICAASLIGAFALVILCLRAYNKAKRRKKHKNKK